MTLGGPGRPRYSRTPAGAARTPAPPLRSALGRTPPAPSSASGGERAEGTPGRARQRQRRRVRNAPPPEAGGETEARGGGRGGARARRREGKAWERCSGGGTGPLGACFLAGDLESLPRALSSLSRETCLPPPPEPECGLFILGLSCRHSSTFFRCSGCPFPRPRFQACLPPGGPRVGDGRRGLFFQPAVPCLSPLPLSPLPRSLSFSVSLTVHRSALASVLTPRPWLWRQTPG